MQLGKTNWEQQDEEAKQEAHRLALELAEAEAADDERWGDAMNAAVDEPLPYVATRGQRGGNAVFGKSQTPNIPRSLTHDIYRI